MRFKARSAIEGQLLATDSRWAGYTRIPPAIQGHTCMD